MERVKTLIQKLQQLVEQNASADQLLLTIQMLQAELIKQNISSPGTGSGKVEIIMPSVYTIVFQNGNTGTKAEPEPEPEEKIIEVLQVDEKEIEEELEEIKRNAEAKNNMSSQAKPALLFDPMEDVPTLTHQMAPPKTAREINESIETQSSLNERLKEKNTELADKLVEEPIKDLKKAIGINDRFLFINELFRGDESMYERSIKTINNFSILAEAEYWIQRELKVKIGWRDSEVVRQFDQLVKRRFA